jgi:prolyl-tRNA editing enzyme YbaK/EbsC (Cys-tRNA(Pro) deacylase)
VTTETVRRHLSRFGVEERIRTLDSDTKTVPRAAEAIGVEPDRIVKTLAVRVKGKNRVLAIAVKGTARLDNAKFKKTFGGKAGFIAAGECLELTGHPPGGVCPFGLKEGVEIYLDESLRDFGIVYPAAGAADNCIAAAIGELEIWSGGEWIDVCV